MSEIQTHVYWRCKGKSTKTKNLDLCQYVSVIGAVLQSLSSGVGDRYFSIKNKEITRKKYENVQTFLQENLFYEIVNGGRRLQKLNEKQTNKQTNKQTKKSNNNNIKIILNTNYTLGPQELTQVILVLQPAAYRLRWWLVGLSLPRDTSILLGFL